MTAAAGGRGEPATVSGRGESPPRQPAARHSPRRVGPGGGAVGDWGGRPSGTAPGRRWTGGVALRRGRRCPASSEVGPAASTGLLFGTGRGRVPSGSAAAGVEKGPSREETGRTLHGREDLGLGEDGVLYDSPSGSSKKFGAGVPSGAVRERRPGEGGFGVN